MKIISKVEKGKERGKVLGFPTLNIDVHDVPANLGHGVYSCRCKIKDLILFDGVMHFGEKKTFNESETCEIHLFNFSENVPPGTEIECEIFNKIRGIRKFRDSLALKKQIEKDILGLCC